MFQHILVAIEGSESSLLAADAAIELAALFHARLDIISVEETAPRYVATHEENTREQAAVLSYYERLQAPLLRKAAQPGVQVQGVILSGHEGQSILHYIKEQHCDLLVLGFQGHSGVWGAFLGSTADKLVSHAPCSTLIIRSRLSKAVFKHILVALDGSPLSWQALRAGVRLGRPLDATVHILSVIENVKAPPVTSATLPPGTGAARWDWTTYFQQIQALAASELQLAGLKGETFTRQGSASALMTTVAREKSVDVVVLGATGQEHPWSPTTGGTARKVANEAPCAVLIVRPRAMRLHVRDVMESNVATVMPDTELSEVIRKLVDGGEKILVVVDDERRVPGVITLGQLLSRDAVLQSLDLPRAAGTAHLNHYVDQLLTTMTTKTAADVISKYPLVVGDDVSLDEAARRMDSEHVTRMPVVNSVQQLVGILDQANLLQYFADQVDSPEMVVMNRHMQSQAFPRTVGECVLSQAPLLTPDTPLFEVLRQVQETSSRRVIVVDSDGKAIGVIADSDILAARGLMTRHNPVMALAGRLSLHFPEEFLRRAASSGPLVAQQVMRPRLFSVPPVTPVAEAVRLMLEHRIKRLVVVDEQGKPLGLVDRQQLLRSLIEGS